MICVQVGETLLLWWSSVVWWIRSAMSAQEAELVSSCWKVSRRNKIFKAQIFHLNL